MLKTPFFLSLAISSAVSLFASGGRAQVFKAVTRYEMISKGPVAGSKAGEKTLGYSYRTQSLDDAKTLGDEAADIMTNLVSEATIDKYQRVVITAVGPQGSAAGSAQGFVARPSGEWVEEKTLGEHTPMIAAVTAAYRKLDAAFQSENVAAIHASVSPLFVHEASSGSEETIDHEVALMKSQLKSIALWQTSVAGVFIRGDWAYVVATQEFTGEAYDSKHVLQNVHDISRSLDTWVSNARDAKLVRSRDLDEQMSPRQ